MKRIFFMALVQITLLTAPVKAVQAAMTETTGKGNVEFEVYDVKFRGDGVDAWIKGKITHLDGTYTNCYEEVFYYPVEWKGE